jgi:protocatechuate 3,4-dioxygenase beta subunit
MPVLTRRAWLAKVALVGVAAPCATLVRPRAQGLDRFVVPAPAPCTAKTVPTPAADVGAGFRPDAPLRRDLSAGASDGRAIAVSGAVIGITCGRIRGARVDLWQANALGRTPADPKRLRAHQITDAEGRFEFATIVPGAAADRAPRLNLRVEVPALVVAKSGKPATLVTALFFPGEPRNAGDPLFRPALAMTAAPATTGAAAYVFDVILDL